MFLDPVFFISYLPKIDPLIVNGMRFSLFIFSVVLDDVIKQSILKELQEEKGEKVRKMCVHISVFIMFSYGNVNGFFSLFNRSKCHRGYQRL